MDILIRNFKVHFIKLAYYKRRSIKIGIHRRQFKSRNSKNGSFIAIKIHFFVKKI